MDIQNILNHFKIIFKKNAKNYLDKLGFQNIENIKHYTNINFLIKFHFQN